MAEVVDQEISSPHHHNSSMEQISRLTDEEFMEIVKNYPAVYDRRCDGFKDKTYKEKSWEGIAQRLELPLEDVKRRYDTIRTRLSRYLKKIKEGYWVNDISTMVDSKIDYLHWLAPHIKTREGGTSLMDLKRNEHDSYMSESLDDNASAGEKESKPFYNNENGASEVDSNDRISMILIPDSSNNKPDELDLSNDKLHSSISSSYQSINTQFQPPDKGKRKINSTASRHSYEMRKQRRVIEYDLDSGSERNVSVLPRKYIVADTNEYDYDEYYCKSLVGRFKKLDSKHKAYLRSNIEKMFLDFELGHVQFPKRPQNIAKTQEL